MRGEGRHGPPLAAQVVEKPRHNDGKAFARATGMPKRMRAVKTRERSQSPRQSPMRRAV